LFNAESLKDIKTDVAKMAGENLHLSLAKATGRKIKRQRVGHKVTE